MLSAEFLNQRLDEKKQYQENYQNKQEYENKFRKNAIEVTQKYFGNFDDYLEVKESGRLKVKDNKKDTTEILP